MIKKHSSYISPMYFHNKELTRFELKDIEDIKNGTLIGEKLLNKVKSKPQRDYYIHRIFGIDGARDSSYIGDYPSSEGFQPSYMNAIIGMINRLKLTSKDVFYDLGSGRGMLINFLALVTPAKINGIEIVEEYYKDSISITKDFNVSRVNTTHSNVLDVDFSDGTVFYTFNPFNWGVQCEVVKRLYKIAKTKKIRIVSLYNEKVFNCQPWLEQTHFSKYRCNDIEGTAIWESNL